jgi:hypothetical protein
VLEIRTSDLLMDYWAGAKRTRKAGRSEIERLGFGAGRGLEQEAVFHLASSIPHSPVSQPMIKAPGPGRVAAVHPSVHRSIGHRELGQRPVGLYGAYRLPSRNRPTFHTSPHAPQRQYVAALTTLLVVFRSCERQVGQCYDVSPASSTRDM